MTTSVSKVELASFAEGVDRLVTVEVSGRGVIHDLYQGARALTTSPLCMGAAELLRAALEPRGRAVVIATGFPVHPFYLPEQDGLIGAASLARALVLAYAARPILVVNPADITAAESALIAAGIYSRSVTDAMTLPVTAAVVSLPADDEDAASQASRLMERVDPAAFISIERPGANEHGEYHSGGGIRLTDHCGRVEQLLNLVRSAGRPTIAIGDGGNELGCNLIRQEVLRAVPNASKCRCPCEGSVVPTAKVDWLVTASVSNWGGYGVEACLAALERTPELLHTPDMDERIHGACATAMANNGAENLLDLGSDAVAMDVHRSVLHILNWMVRNAALDTGRYYTFPRYSWLDQVL